MLPHCSTSGVSRRPRVCARGPIEITPAAPRVAHGLLRRPGRAIRSPSTTAPFTSLPSYAARRRSGADVDQRQRDAAGGVLNELIASATRCVSRDSRTSPAGPPRRSVPRSCSQPLSGVGEGLRSAGCRPAAARRSKISCCDCSNAGLPASRHSGAMNVDDVHRHPGVDATPRAADRSLPPEAAARDRAAANAARPAQLAATRTSSAHVTDARQPSAGLTCIVHLAL